MLTRIKQPYSAEKKEKKKERQKNGLEETRAEESQTSC
jgi:hypothetical protein